MRTTGGILNRVLSWFIKRMIVAAPIVVGVHLLLSGFDQDSNIVFLDVGQGDSILIQQNDVQILIDGGPDATVLFEISKYMSPKDMYLDFIVLTHPHADHINGLLEVIDKYEIGEIWVNAVEYDVQAYEYLKSLDLNFRELKAGDVLKYEDIYIEVLYPFEIDDIQDSNINNESIVLYAEIEGESVYLMGDAEEEVERELVSKYDLEDADILKAGHHCSKTASSEGFLEELNPALGICSLGEGNRFGHPHNETLERFEKFNVQHISTKDEGNIMFRFRE